MSIYRLMLRGEPLSVERIAASLDMLPKAVNQFQEFCSGMYYNDAGSIIGYWGLLLSETRNRFEVDGYGLYSWCAWDALFIPAIIHKTAIVTSGCPVTGDHIIKSFCHYVNFFRSKSAGEHRVSENPGTFLLTLNEAFALGWRKMNCNSSRC